MLGRVNGERRHQQTLRQTSADAVDETRRPPAASDSNTHARRHAPAAVRAMVSRPGERQFTRRRSSRHGVNTPQIVMLSKPLEQRFALLPCAHEKETAIDETVLHARRYTPTQYCDQEHMVLLSVAHGAARH